MRYVLLNTDICGLCLLLRGRRYTSKRGECIIQGMGGCGLCVVCHSYRLVIGLIVWRVSECYVTVMCVWWVILTQ